MTEIPRELQDSIDEESIEEMLSRAEEIDRQNLLHCTHEELANDSEECESPWSAMLAILFTDR